MDRRRAGRASLSLERDLDELNRHIASVESSLRALVGSQQVSDGAVRAALSAARRLRHWADRTLEDIQDAYVSSRGRTIPMDELVGIPLPEVRVSAPERLPQALTCLLDLCDDDAIWGRIPNDVAVEIGPVLDVMSSADDEYRQMRALAAAGRLAVQTFNTYRDRLPAPVVDAIDDLAACL